MIASFGLFLLWDREADLLRIPVCGHLALLLHGLWLSFWLDRSISCAAACELTDQLLWAVQIKTWASSFTRCRCTACWSVNISLRIDQLLIEPLLCVLIQILRNFLEFWIVHLSIGRVLHANLTASVIVLHTRARLACSHPTWISVLLYQSRRLLCRTCHRLNRL